MRIKKMGPISFCKTREIDRLKKQLKEAECRIKILREEQARLQDEVKEAQRINVPRIRDLIVQAKEMNFEKMDDSELNEACCFPIHENQDTGKWCVSLSICNLGGCEYEDYEFETRKDAFEFGYILTHLGWTLDCSSPCPQCYAEYIQACI